MKHATRMVDRVNTFEAPPRSPRVDCLPPPFVPRLPAPVKRQTVMTMPSNFPLVVKQETAAAPPNRPAGPPPPVTLINVESPPRRHPARARRALQRATTMIVLMAMVAGGVFAYQRLAPQAPPHPAAWDPRVAPIAAFVETQRELTFDHPIFVDFLSDDQFTVTATGGATSVDERTREAARRSSDVLDAFGLTSGYDALAGDGVLSSASSLGFYSPRTDRITLRGTELTPALRVVLAHELTHALQAQHFGMHLGGPDDLARRSVSEADAMRVEGAFRATLTPDEQMQAVAGTTLDPAAAASLAAVPWPVVAYRYAPYRLGPTLLQTVYTRQGNKGVDELLRDPPSEALLLSPWRFFRGDVENRVQAEAPPLVSVEQGSQPLSLMQVLLMLDAWLPWSMARGALDTWAGGAYVLYRYADSGPLCAAVAVQFAGDPQPFADAVSWWAGAAGSTARPGVNGNEVRFDVCARGPGAATPPQPVVDTNSAILIENAAVPIGSDVEGVRDAMPFLCTARTLIDDPAIGPLLLEAAVTPQEQAAIDAARGAALRTCAG